MVSDKPWSAGIHSIAPHRARASYNRGHPRNDVPPGTLKSILKQAKVTNKRSHIHTMIYERAENGWGAYAPDLPGLGVVGDILELERLIRDGLALHIAGLVEDGFPIPEPVTRAAEIKMPA